jgi:hypothetical protein
MPAQSTLVQEAIYGLAQMIAETGTFAIFRNLTALNGPSPAPNPPLLVGPVATTGLALAGASAIGFRARTLSGRLIAGDRFTLSSDGRSRTVTGTVISVGNQFGAVPFAPALEAGAPINTMVFLTWAADTRVGVLVSDPVRLKAGGVVQETDLTVRFLAQPPGVPQPLVPTVTDKILLGQDAYSIVSIKKNELQGTIYGYSCLVRR